MRSKAAMSWCCIISFTTFTCPWKAAQCSGVKFDWKTTRVRYHTLLVYQLINTVNGNPLDNIKSHANVSITYLCYIYVWILLIHFMHFRSYCFHVVLYTSWTFIISCLCMMTYACLRLSFVVQTNYQVIITMMLVYVYI